MAMRLTPTIVVLLLASVAGPVFAAPRDSSTNPLPDEHRARTALRLFSTGPWVQGDWALKCMVSSGRKQDKVSAAMEVVGGWNVDTGRWQRLRLPDGHQWVIISGIGQNTDLPAKPASTPSPAGNSEAVATLILSDGSHQAVYADTPAQKPDTPTISAKKNKIKTDSSAKIWEVSTDGKSRELNSEERARAIIDRMNLNWDAYLMDFLGAGEVSYKGVERLRARWCDVMELSPATGPYAKALVYIDTEFGAPIEAELYDNTGSLAKTIRAVSVQKVQNDWILKRWEVLEGASRNKIILEVVAVSLGHQWSPKLYSEGSKPADWPAIPPEEWNFLE